MLCQVEGVFGQNVGNCATVGAAKRIAGQSARLVRNERTSEVTSRVKNFVFHNWVSQTSALIGLRNFPNLPSAKSFEYRQPLEELEQTRRRTERSTGNASVIARSDGSADRPVMNTTNTSYPTEG